jgi:hypothetical protein
MTPGLKFFAEQIDPVYPATGLYPTMSTYQFGFDLEGGPKQNELYVVCKDGSIQSVYEPDRPIGWELIEDGDDWFYRVTQMNHPRKRCAVRYHSRMDDPPKGRGRIGSVVAVCRRIEDPPQTAEVATQDDEGEDEVTSTPPSTPRGEPVCPDAPQKSDLRKIAELDSNLALAAAMLNDPEQTAAMAKFAEGKLSYAEMRMLCG